MYMTKPPGVLAGSLAATGPVTHTLIVLLGILWTGVHRVTCYLHHSERTDNKREGLGLQVLLIYMYYICTGEFYGDVLDGWITVRVTRITWISLFPTHNNAVRS